MYENIKKLIFILPATLLICLFACAKTPVYQPVDRISAYTVNDDETVLSRYAPVFVIEKCQKRYGGVTVMGDAYCEKHNYRYPFYQMPCPPCPKCAEEEGLCISCGKKLEPTEPTEGNTKENGK